MTTNVIIGNGGHWRAKEWYGSKSEAEAAASYHENKKENSWYRARVIKRAPSKDDPSIYKRLSKVWVVYKWMPEA